MRAKRREGGGGERRRKGRREGEEKGKEGGGREGREGKMEWRKENTLCPTHTLLFREMTRSFGYYLPVSPEMMSPLKATYSRADKKGSSQIRICII